MKIAISIKAILFGVTENVIGTLDIGNSYVIERDNLKNSKLWKEFEYTDFGIRRMYEMATLNEELDVAILTKKLELNDSDLTFAENVDDSLQMLEHDELTYVDMKCRVIRLFSENSFSVKEMLFNTSIIDNDGNKTLYWNSRSSFEDIMLYHGFFDSPFANMEEIVKINNYIKNTQIPFRNTKFDSETLELACDLYDKTYTSIISQTLPFMAGVIGIESLLVNDNVKTDLTYRFIRNGAMLLSNNEKEYKELSKKFKRIYKLRSEYVHTGKVRDLSVYDIFDVREMLRKIIFKIVELNIDKKQLLEKLDLKGYIVNLKE